MTEFNRFQLKKIIGAMKGLALYFFIPVLLMARLVAPEESIAYNYSPRNFKQQIEQMDGNFIMFYAPWCRHCTDFQPIWYELAEMVNTPDSKFVIAQVDCTAYSKLCNEVDVTGYPTLLYFHKNSFQAIEYKGTRDLPSLMLFLSEIFAMRSQGIEIDSTSNEVKIYNGMAYLTDQNVERFISKGQHFILFYAPWCKRSQNLAPTWAELAKDYAQNDSVQIGKINCMEHTTTCLNFDVKDYPQMLWIVNGKVMGKTIGDQSLEDLNQFVEKMARPENHNPEKFLKKKKILPVARISEDTFEMYMKKELVFINYFATWCAHCKQMVPIWLELGLKYQNNSRIIIADVDCSQSETLCVQENIYQFPYLIMYKKSKIVHKHKGTNTLVNLEQTVETQLKELNEDAEKIPEQIKDEL